MTPVRTSRLRVVVTGREVRESIGVGVQVALRRTYHAFRPLLLPVRWTARLKFYEGIVTNVLSCFTANRIQEARPSETKVSVVDCRRGHHKAGDEQDREDEIITGTT